MLYLFAMLYMNFITLRLDICLFYIIIYVILMLYSDINAELLHRKIIIVLTNVRTLMHIETACPYEREIRQQLLTQTL